MCCTPDQPQQPPLPAVGLYGRAGHRAVGAVHTAVTRLGSEHCVTALALVEPLADVGGQGLVLDVIARRAGQKRFQDDGSHCSLLTKIDGPLRLGQS